MKIFLRPMSILVLTIQKQAKKDNRMLKRFDCSNSLMWLLLLFNTTFRWDKQYIE